MNQEKMFQQLLSKDAIQTTILKYATAADLRDWVLYKSILANELDVDFSSFANGPIAHITSDQLLAQVKGLIPGFDTTQHQLTNFVITINDACDEADASAYMQAEHFIRTDDKELFHTVGGYYVYKLKCTNNQWKIHSLKLVVTWTRGNMDAYRIATERVMKS
ncbi:MAG: nuclear transport factor 2 family protein [Bacillota bacterium]